MLNEVLGVRDIGNVRVLTMNRAGKLNALNFALTEALVAALEAAEADANVHAVVLTGAGRGFCAGADTSEFKELTPDNASLVKLRSELTGRLHSIIPQMKTPVIAAVNGIAMGGGAGLALACDYVIADEEAVFAYPEVKHGIVAAIVMASLVKHVGRKKAFGLVATGRKVDAKEAVAIGLASEIATAGASVEQAIEMAAQIAVFLPRAVGAAKTLLQKVGDIPLLDGIATGIEENARMRGYAQANKS